MILPPKRYRAVIFHPGARTRWRTARNFEKTGRVSDAPDKMEPDPSEVIAERDFRFRCIAEAWARAQLKRLRNVCAEIYDTAIDG